MIIHQDNTNKQIHQEHRSKQDEDNKVPGELKLSSLYGAVFVSINEIVHQIRPSL